MEWQEPFKASLVGQLGGNMFYYFSSLVVIFKYALSADLLRNNTYLPEHSHMIVFLLYFLNDKNVEENDLWMK